MKKLLLFMFLVFTVEGSAQFRLVYNETGIASDTKVYFTDGSFLYFSAYSGGARRIYKSNGTASSLLRDANTNAYGHLDNNADFQWVGFGGNYYSSMRLDVGVPYVVKIFPNATVQKFTNLSTPVDASNSTLISYPTVLTNGKMIYGRLNVTETPGGTGDEPFVFDTNTNANSLLKDINTGLFHSNPKDFTVLGTNIFFSAFNGVTNQGRELWVTDGTSAGTNLYLDIFTGTDGSGWANNSNPEELTMFTNSLIFSATHNTLGRELFKTNGAGSLNVVKDINTSGDSNPSNITDINGVLYFSADNGSVGHELWKSNGFNAGTLLVKDINPTGASNPSKFIAVGSIVYFIANDGVNGVELWKTDGTSGGTVLVKNINPSGSSNPNYLTEYNGKLYFSADNGTNGIELWVSDGTSAGTTMLELNTSGSGDVSHLVVFNNELFFGADAGGGLGKELYAYMDPALAANDFQLAGNTINLYPNPAKSHFELATTATIEKVEVYSLQGQLVKTFANQNQYEINDLAKGMYIVKINAQEGIANKTLVIE